MSLVLASLLAATPAVVPTCSWDHPGVNPFMGDVVAAVDRYADIPADVRKRLKSRMAQRDYDEIAVITRDAISGRAQYGAEIREMHFGAGQICKTVTRSRWTEAWKERGLVYCEANHCIIVPTVCRNVSRITRKDPKVASENGRREEAVPAKDPADDVASDNGRRPNAPSLATLTPQGATIDNVANAHGGTGWSAWNTAPAAPSGSMSSGNSEPWSAPGAIAPSGRTRPISGLPVLPGGGVIDDLIAGTTNHSRPTDGGTTPSSPQSDQDADGSSGGQPTGPGGGNRGHDAPAGPGAGGGGSGNGGTGHGSSGKGGGSGITPQGEISPLFPNDPAGPNVPQDLNPPSGPINGGGAPGGQPNVVPLSGNLTPTTGTVPEPSSAVLVLLAAGALVASRRRRPAR